MCCMDFDGRFHLPLHCLERRQSVCACWPVHLSLNVSDPCLIILPRAVWSSTTHFPTLQRDLHACRQTTHIFRFSLLCTSCSSVCKQLLNIGIRFPWERMGTCNSAESPRKWGSFEYLQPPNCLTTAALLERSLMR